MPTMPAWLTAALAKARPITDAILAHASIMADALTAAQSGDAVKVIEDLATFSVDIYEAVHANTGAAK